MENFIIFFVLSLLVGIWGSYLKIGFGWAFFWSLLLSPLIGLIIVLCSGKDYQMRYFDFQEPLELGEEAELEGNYKKAVDYYKQSLFRLENDYKNLIPHDEVEFKRRQLIKDLNERISDIKLNNPKLFGDTNREL